MVQYRASAFLSPCIAECSYQNQAVSVGQMAQVAAVALGAWLVANNASPLQRLWLAPPLVFGLGFIDSSIQGLCTESWVMSCIFLFVVILMLQLLMQCCSWCMLRRFGCCNTCDTAFHVLLCSGEKMPKCLGAANFQLKVSVSRLVLYLHV